MRQFALALLATCALAWGAPPASADTIHLSSYAFNVNGTIDVDTMPVFANAAGFNVTTGLGTITLDYRPGPGTYDLFAFFDHDITGLTNPFDNELGAAVGTPPAGVSWEIDEPGYTVGNLIANVAAGSLDNKVLDGTTNGPQDLAMALGFDITIPNADHRALITLLVSTTAPGGFYLHQFDSGGDVFLSSRFDITEIPTGGEVPEPVSLLLVGSGLAFGLRRLRRR